MSVRQTQSNGNVTIRLARFERHLEEATVKWRINAEKGSQFHGQVGTIQFQSGDEVLDLIIPVADIPQDNPEEQFQVILDQPINASLGEKTTCDVSVINDKSKFLKYVSYQFLIFHPFKRPEKWLLKIPYR